jgi:hypothetical protein
MLVGKPEGRRPLGRPMRGWEVIIQEEHKYYEKVWAEFPCFRMGSGDWQNGQERM